MYRGARARARAGGARARARTQAPSIVIHSQAAASVQPGGMAGSDSMQGLDGLVRNIGIISRNNSVLASMLSHLDAGHGESTEPRDLRVLLKDTGIIARETGELLLSLQASSKVPGRQRSMLVKLNKDFQFVLRRFQQLAEQAVRHAHSEPGAGGDLESGGGGGANGGGGGWDDEGDERSSLVEAEATRMRAQQRLVARNSAEATAERERMIKQVETTVVEVNEIFTDLAGLVAGQSSSIDTISSMIENTADKAREATEELRTASRYHGRGSRRCLIFAGALLGGIVLILVLQAKVG